MSYRLITKALFVVISAAGFKSEREVQVRAYPSPKRDASGNITIDGEAVSYKRTGGKGRGTADNRYMYATVKGESAFWPITEAEATALAGGTATLASIAATVAEPAKTEQASSIDALPPTEQLMEQANKVAQVARRVKGKGKVAA